MKLQILGINIDKINLTTAIEKVAEYINSDSQHYIVTVNPEFIVAARSHEKFKSTLNLASLALCDGFGLILASGGKLKRVTGVDISENLLQGRVESAKIFLLGGAAESAKKLMTKYPNTVCGSEIGGIVNDQTWLLDNNEIIIRKINDSGANTLLVGFGQVKQEMWIDQNLPKLPNIKVAIGVGGTFDYLSGQVKRAPKLLRMLGLEWFFRLISQPQRIGRIFNATIKFGWLLTINRK